MPRVAHDDAQRTASALTAALLDKLTQQAEKSARRRQQLMGLGVCKLVVVLAQAHMRSASVQCHAMLFMERLTRSGDGRSALDAAGACKVVIAAVYYCHAHKCVVRYGLSAMAAFAHPGHVLPNSQDSLTRFDAAVQTVAAAFRAHMTDTTIVHLCACLVDVLCSFPVNCAHAGAAGILELIVATQQQASRTLPVSEEDTMVQTPVVKAAATLACEGPYMQQLQELGVCYCQSSPSSLLGLTASTQLRILL